jgi:hypothetical protein
MVTPWRMVPDADPVPVSHRCVRGMGTVALVNTQLTRAIREDRSGAHRRYRSPCCGELGQLGSPILPPRESRRQAPVLVLESLRVVLPIGLPEPIQAASPPRGPGLPRRERAGEPVEGGTTTKPTCQPRLASPVWIGRWLDNLPEMENAVAKADFSLPQRCRNPQPRMPRMPRMNTNEDMETGDFSLISY